MTLEVKSGALALQGGDEVLTEGVPIHKIAHGERQKLIDYPLHQASGVTAGTLDGQQI
jgi:hypothetical protein